MAVHMLLPMLPPSGTRSLGGAIARVVTGMTCMWRLLPFIFMAAALNHPAQAAKSVVKYANIRQLLGSRTPTHMGPTSSASKSR